MKQNIFIRTYSDKNTMALVTLRPIELSDVDNMMTWVNDPEIIGNFANFGKPFTREDEEQYIRRILASQNDRVFAVESNQGEYIGNVGIHNIYWPSRNGRLAIIIGNKHAQGQGLGQAALRGIVKNGFEDLNLHKLWLRCFKTNKRAVHIYKKHGFSEDGVDREEYFHKGDYHDLIKMSMLDREYKKLKETELWKT